MDQFHTDPLDQEWLAVGHLNDAGDDLGMIVEPEVRGGTGDETLRRFGWEAGLYPDFGGRQAPGENHQDTKTRKSFFVSSCLSL
jgi:hypothetical protein